MNTATVNPTKTLAGIWHNQHGSQINLLVLDDGRLAGTFKSGVGPGGQEPREFSLVGFNRDGVLTFCVDFNHHDSMTAWVGQMSAKSNDKLELMWHMALNTHCDSRKTWRSTLSGFDVFTRASQVIDAENICNVSHPMWCGII